MQNSQTLSFEQIANLVKKITYLELSKRENFYVEQKIKKEKQIPLLGVLKKNSVNESKINDAIKWVNKLWNLR